MSSIPAEVQDSLPLRGRRAPRTSGDDRERAILETLERLLEGRSFSEISVDDLARGAGISRPTFYFYFPSKHAVLLALVDRMVDEAAARRDELLAGLPKEPREAWREALELYFRIFGSRRAVILAAAEVRATSAEARALWGQVMENWIADAATLIELERGRGAAPDGLPARDLATALVQMNEGVMHAAISGDAPAVAEERVVDVLLGVWLGAIYGTPDPASPRP